MAYTRKTHDDYEIQMHTAEGWECVDTETTFRAGRISLREYRENDPHSQFRLKTVRIPNTTETESGNKTMDNIEFTADELTALTKYSEIAAGAIAEIHAILSQVTERVGFDWMGNEQTVHEIVDELANDIGTLASSRSFVKAKFENPINWVKG